LSPFDSLSFLTTLGFAAAYLAARRFGLALECADRALHDQPDWVVALRIKPGWVVALRIKIVACARAGRLDEARGEVARLLSVYPKMTVANETIGDLFCTGIRRAEHYRATTSRLTRMRTA
jgi:hypothetical protein